ncbi:hypothetical protein MPSEU_000565200 [Mayamaea pseudoterrestris]|nr:hypothetical protein MPSEU_000565200 [Mayamaea pseudoterrestris]
MIFRWLLPKDGGGAMRRYVRFRESMLRRKFDSKDMEPYRPITLFDFRQTDDAMDAKRIQRDKDAWRISDDGVIGGFSQSSARLIRSKAELFRYAAGHADDIENELTPSEDKELFTPYIKWKGKIDTTIGLASNVQRSGFAAMRSPQFPMEGANLKGMYGALEITCRSDGRLYTVNLKVATAFPDDMYQGYLQQSHVRLDPMGNLAGPMETLILPFADFGLTSMGREREIHRELDDNICIESLGFALMDGQNGAFQFDLARVRVVNLQEGRVFEGIAVDEESNESTGSQP